MRSSVPTLEKHYLKNGGVGDEPREEEPDQQQQQQILNEINKNIVKTSSKIKEDIINEKTLIKTVEQPLIKQVEKTKNKN